MTINLFVGDCTEYLSVIATEFDKTAYLLEFSNFDQYLKSSDVDITVYTSASDLPKISKDRAVFYEVLQKADNIYYRPPIRWSDYDLEFSLQNQQQLTEYFLYLIDREKHNVNGLDLSAYISTPYLSLKNQRTNEDPQLWTAGCSITAGNSVSIDEKYTTIISHTFGNKFLDLSKNGSSLEFAADQILRSDIRSGDTVVWGLTTEYRAPYWDRTTQTVESINHYTYNYKRTNKADDIADETRLYKSAICFNQVENFCTKIGARLIAVPILCSESLQLLLHHHKCYYQLPYQPG
jgi:hypothetical protein